VCDQASDEISIRTERRGGLTSGWTADRISCRRSFVALAAHPAGHPRRCPDKTDRKRTPELNHGRHGDTEEEDHGDVAYTRRRRTGSTHSPHRSWFGEHERGILSLRVLQEERTSAKFGSGCQAGDGIRRSPPVALLRVSVSSSAAGGETHSGRENWTTRAFSGLRKARPLRPVFCQTMMSGRSGFGHRPARKRPDSGRIPGGRFSQTGVPGTRG